MWGSWGVLQPDDRLYLLKKCKAAIYVGLRKAIILYRRMGKLYKIAFNFWPIVNLLNKYSHIDCYPAETVGLGVENRFNFAFLKLRNT